MPRQFKIALVACEESGDYLGGELIGELKKILPHVVFIGVGGKKMCREGLNSYISLERLTAHGITEIVSRLPSLWQARRHIKKYLVKNRPDIFIGIDAPDFNIGLERALRNHAIKTVHYVSPTIWAWRPRRIRKLKKAAQLVLCLYPFETAYYDKERIPALYIGHPLADKIALHNDRLTARRRLKKEYSLGSLQGKWLALLPGSRPNELKQLGEIFIQSALRCLEQRPQLQFLIAVTSLKHENYLAGILRRENAPPQRIQIIREHSHTVMAAADAVLLAAGTASLECLLVKRPMIVAYRISRLSYWILKRMIRVPYISQPNWLFNGPLVEEYIQREARVENLAPALLKTLDSPSPRLHKEYTKIHLLLRRDAGAQAARAIQNLLEEKGYATG